MNKELFYNDKNELEKVKLIDGIFKTSQVKGKEYLLYLDLDRLIAPFYEAVGKSPKKKRYGGWEAMGISGHSLGHWLSASSYMYGATDDSELFDKLNYVIDELEIIQSYDEKGYLSGFPRRCFDIAFSGEFEVNNFELAGHWVPWYSIHKVFAGLLDVYRITANEKALSVLLKLSNWAYEGTKELTDEQFQKMITSEIGGMNDTFAEIFMLTGNEKYLELSKRFCQKLILDPLAQNIDELEGKHSNSQIPKILGAARLYNITGVEYYKDAAQFFYNQVVKYRTYVIGGNSKGEHLGALNDEELGVTTTETCNTYNMLKLAEILYKWNPKAEYMDFYERALFNHILPSQDPDNGTKTYFVSTEPGHFKIYCSKEDSFWCCTGTGMENPARYNKNIYYSKDNEVYINQFISSEYFDKGNNVRIIQKTCLPSSKWTRFEIEHGDKLDFLKIRIPSWSKKNSFILNGKEVYPKVENDYAIIENILSIKDILEIEFDIKLYLYKAKDNSKKISFMYGPVVLAGALGKEGMPESDNCISQMDYSDWEPLNVSPIICDEEKVLDLVEKISEFPLEFKLKLENKDIKLVPFYDIAHERYTLYWKRYNEDEKVEEVVKEKLSVIKVLDKVLAYEQQSEIEHSFKYKDSLGNYSNEHKRFYRYGEKEGYFSYEFKVKSAEKYFLEVEELVMEEEPLDFIITIDDIALFRASMRIEKNRGIKIYKMELPYYLLNGKEKITISIKGNEIAETGKISKISINYI